MSFVTQEDVFAAIEPVLHGVFEEFGGGRDVTPPPFPRIPYDEAMLRIRLRQARSAQPARDRATSTEVFRGSGFAIFAARDRAAAGWCGRCACRAPRRGPRSFFDKLNDWAQRRGRAGARLHHLRATGRRARADRQVPRRRAHRGLRATDRRRATATPCSSSATGAPRPRSSPARRARSIGAGARPRSTRTVPVLLDRRFPDVRVQRGAPARSISATTRSRCRRAGSKRWRRRTR